MPGHPAPLPLKATTPVPASNGKIINMARKKNYAEKRLSRLQDTTTEARTTFTVIDLKGINDLLGGGENRVAIREAVFERLASEPRLANLRKLTSLVGETFDYSLLCFATAVEWVRKDATLGNIPMPHTAAEWIESLVAEYVANVTTAESIWPNLSFS